MLTLPNGNSSFPIVLFVHGSGPNDRDESIGPNKPFRDLAHGLASQGIASIRYDKRTLVYANLMESGSMEITLDTEVLIDVNNAIELADSVKGAEQVFVLGHSLGAMLSPKIALKSHELEGIIMLAGNARPLEDLILEQYTYLLSPDGISNEEQVVLDETKLQIKHLEKLKQDPDDQTLDLPLGLPASYWISLINYNQTEDIKLVESRILILQGERDYQVTMEDFALWEKALISHENTQFKSYPKLNHLFLEGEGQSRPAEYQIEGEIPRYVIDDIAEWIMNFE